MTRDIKINGVYRHFKQGNQYKVLLLGYDCETTAEVVIYQALYGDNKVWVRNKEMFLSEVDKDKYPDATQKYRFELVE